MLPRLLAASSPSNTVIALKNMVDFQKAFHRPQRDSSQALLLSGGILAVGTGLVAVTEPCAAAGFILGLGLTVGMGAFMARATENRARKFFATTIPGRIAALDEHGPDFVEIQRILDELTVTKSLKSSCIEELREKFTMELPSAGTTVS